MAQVTDANSKTATKSLSISVGAASQGLTISTSSLPGGTVGSAYSVTLQASGGTAPYTWGITAGALPVGLNLAAASGVISGTPTAAGKPSFTVQVSDSASNTATKSLSISIAAVGASSGVCTLATTAVGWTWECPQLSMNFAKINLLSKVDDTDIVSAGDHCAGGANCETQMETKYAASGGNWTNWGTQMSTRLASLGFTGAGYYSYRFISASSSGDLPYESSQDFGFDAIRDTASGLGGPFHVKDAGWITDKPGMKCAPGFTATTPDPYDPEFLTAFETMYSSQVTSSGIDMSRVIFFQADDGDNLGVMNSCCSPNNAHPDYGYVFAANSPMQSTSSATAGGTFTFSNKTYWVKQALRDWLLNEYLCTGAGQPVATCSGVGTGTGSADPSSGNYVGAGNASSALSSLNSAWHTSYTTWNTSDSNGLNGIASGSYASWGTGAGFLDENGSNLVSSSVSCSGLDGNGLQQNQSWAAAAQIQTDLDHFVAFGFAATWASEIYTAYSAECGSSCAPLGIPDYDGPNTPNSSSVYQGMGQALAGKSIPVFFWLAPPFYNNASGFQTEVQNIINNDDGYPVLVGNYFRANPDSYIGGSNDGGCGGDCQPTQWARGSYWQTVNQDVLRLQNPNGKYAVVGFEHWSMFDSFSQRENFGLFTDNDNAYDSSSASTATSSGNCAFTGGNFTPPSICKDVNGNFESYGAVSSSATSCGSSSPTLNANFWGTTAVGICTWFNNGSYARIAESGNWGDALLPVVQFNLSNLADP